MPNREERGEGSFSRFLSGMRHQRRVRIHRGSCRSGRRACYASGKVRVCLIAGSACPMPHMREMGAGVAERVATPKDIRRTGYSDGDEAVSSFPAQSAQDGRWGEGRPIGCPALFDPVALTGWIGRKGPGSQRGDQASLPADNLRCINGKLTTRRH